MGAQGLGGDPFHLASGEDALLQGLRGLTLSLHAMLADMPRNAAAAQQLRAILSNFDGLLAHAEPGTPRTDLHLGPRDLGVRLCRLAESVRGVGVPRLTLRQQGLGWAAAPRVEQFIGELLLRWLQPLAAQPRGGRLDLELWWLEPVLFLRATAAPARLQRAEAADCQTELAALGGHMRLGPPRAGRAVLTLALPAEQAYRRG